MSKILNVCKAVTLLVSLSAFQTLSAQTHEVPEMSAGEPRLLTQPYLQNPTERGVSVVWLTNFKGMAHELILERGRGQGKGRNNGKGHGYGHFDFFRKKRSDGGIRARTEKLERMFEDDASRIENKPAQVSRRQVYRHEALAHGLTPGIRYEYRVRSVDANGDVHEAGPYRLQALPDRREPLQILLSSDQQERFNTLANYQKVEEMFPNLDAIFFAGDLANHPRRASEWFDNYLTAWHENPRSANPSFFPAMQGTFGQRVPESPFKGGELMQNVPLFPSIANHEVSGRFRPNAEYMINGNVRTANINSMFNDPHPRWYAQYKYAQERAQINPYNHPGVKDQWIRDNANDFEVYRDLFTLPDDGPEGESYYSKAFGDVFLISMNVSRIWRNWNIGRNDQSKFVEIMAESNNPDEWGFGEHIFTPFAEGSKQHDWLKKTLRSREFKRSKYRVVMFHQSAHGLGDNAVPVLTDPVMYLQYTDEEGLSKIKKVLMPQDQSLRAQVFKSQVEPLVGRIEHIRYEYPIEADYFHRDVEPLLHKHGVQLVLTGHSHVWNRTREGSLNFMETSSVGNCFGAFWTQPDGESWENRRRISGAFVDELEQGADISRWNPANYPRLDDPHGRAMIMPTLANPMVIFAGEPAPVPFVCSNNISVFTILESKGGLVRSFAFDVNDPTGKVLEFDRFSLK